MKFGKLTVLRSGLYGPLMRSDAPACGCCGGAKVRHESFIYLSIYISISLSLSLSISLSLSLSIYIYIYIHIGVTKVLTHFASMLKTAAE